MHSPLETAGALPEEADECIAEAAAILTSADKIIGELGLFGSARFRGGAGENYHTAQLSGCQDFAGDQKWSYLSDQTLHTMGRCLDVDGGGRADFIKVRLYDCTGGPAQKWIWDTGRPKNPSRASAWMRRTGGPACGCRSYRGNAKSGILVEFRSKCGQTLRGKVPEFRDAAQSIDIVYVTNS